MFKVMWWNAKGEAEVSELMTRADAMVFAQSMHVSQDARLVYVNRSN